MHPGDVTSLLQGLDYQDNRIVKGVVCTHRFFSGSAEFFSLFKDNDFSLPVGKTLHVAHDRDYFCPLELFSKS